MLLFLSLVSKGQNAEWAFDIHGGLPWNIPVPMTVYQENQPEIYLNARFRTDPFSAPFFWLWRISRSNGSCSWEFEAVHHKLYLENPTDEIQSFSISHGYNMLIVNRGIQISFFDSFDFLLRTGAGIILAHPENRIREKKLDENLGWMNTGYYVSGPVLNISAGKLFHPVGPIRLNIEFRCNPSWSVVPVADGYARLWNLPLMLVFGTGVDFP